MVGQPGGQLLHVVEAHRDAEGRDQAGRRAAHRRQVGQVGAGRPVPDLPGGQPRPVEVDAVDQHVGRDQHPAGKHRGVIADADEDSRPRARHLCDELDLIVLW